MRKLFFMVLAISSLCIASYSKAEAQKTTYFNDYYKTKIKENKTEIKSKNREVLVLLLKNYIKNKDAKLGSDIHGFPDEVRLLGEKPAVFINYSKKLTVEWKLEGEDLKLVFVRKCKGRRSVQGFVKLKIYNLPSTIVWSVEKCQEKYLLPDCKYDLYNHDKYATTMMVATKVE